MPIFPISLRTRFLPLFFGVLSATLFAQKPAVLDTLNYNVKNPTAILVVSITEGFYHKEAIPAGKLLLAQLGRQDGFNVLHTNSKLEVAKLDFQQFASVVFLCTTLDIFNAPTQDRFERYIKNGGGYLGIHAAADTEYKWPWYGQLVGGYFTSHPPGAPKATITTLSTTNYFTNHLESQWTIADEWYNYDFKNPQLIPLLNLEESSYQGGTNGAKHPISWYHYYDGGRSFYTGLGHLEATYKDSRFVALLTKGLRFTTGQVQP